MTILSIFPYWPKYSSDLRSCSDKDEGNPEQYIIFFFRTRRSRLSKEKKVEKLKKHTLSRRFVSINTHVVKALNYNNVGWLRTS